MPRSPLTGLWSNLCSIVIIHFETDWVKGFFKVNKENHPNLCSMVITSKPTESKAFSKPIKKSIKRIIPDKYFIHFETNWVKGFFKVNKENHPNPCSMVITSKPTESKAFSKPIKKPIKRIIPDKYFEKTTIRSFYVSDINHFFNK